jgi:hypothetical protein
VARTSTGIRHVERLIEHTAAVNLALDPTQLQRLDDVLSRSSWSGDPALLRRPDNRTLGERLRALLDPERGDLRARRGVDDPLPDPSREH